MAEATEISWADATFNPWIGCAKVGPGCDHCYAERDNVRRKWVEGWGPGAQRRRTKTWGDPLRWDRAAALSGQRPRVFCASLADVFDNEVDQAWRNDLWALIRATPNLRWMLLTKRIGNAAKMLPPDWPYANAGLMATVVNQLEADRDVPKLMATPTTWRGLSIEPMVGPIDLEQIRFTLSPGYFGDALQWHHKPHCDRHLKYPAIDWVIAGGESGPYARPLNPAWVRSLRDQCADAMVAFHFKQWGEWAPIEPGKWQGEPDTIGSIFTPNTAAGDMWFGADGHFAEKPPRIWSPSDFAIMRRLGKKKAGWLLDCREHKEFPPALMEAA